MKFTQYEMNKIDDLKVIHSRLTDSGKTHHLYELLGLIIELCDCVEKLDSAVAYKSPEGYILQVEYTDGDVPKELKEVKRLYDEIELEASGRFINSKGQASGYSELRKLCGDAAWVGPGEKDSFGWLTGIIHTPVGKIVYG